MLDALGSRGGLDQRRMDRSDRQMKALEKIVTKLVRDADELERTMERTEPSRYLEWFLSVPADSELFLERRARSSRR